MSKLQTLYETEISTHEGFTSTYMEGKGFLPVNFDVSLGDPTVHVLQDGTLEVIGTSDEYPHQLARLTFDSDKKMWVKNGFYTFSRNITQVWAPDSFNDIAGIKDGVIFSIQNPAEPDFHDLYLGEIQEDIIVANLDRPLISRATDGHIMQINGVPLLWDNSLAVLYSTALDNGMGAKICAKQFDKDTLVPTSDQIDILLPNNFWHKLGGYRIVEGVFFTFIEGIPVLLHSGGPWDGGNYGIGIATLQDSSKGRLSLYECDAPFPQLIYDNPKVGIHAPGHCCVYGNYLFFSSRYPEKGGKRYLHVFNLQNYLEQ